MSLSAWQHSTWMSNNSNTCLKMTISFFSFVNYQTSLDNYCRTWVLYLRHIYIEAFGALLLPPYIFTQQSISSNDHIQKVAKDIYVLASMHQENWGTFVIERTIGIISNELNNEKKKPTLMFIEIKTLAASENI